MEFPTTKMLNHKTRKKKEIFPIVIFWYRKVVVRKAKFKTIWQITIQNDLKSWNHFEEKILVKDHLLLQVPKHDA